VAWLTGYEYRQKVPLKRVDGAVTDYQMLVTVNTSEKTKQNRGRYSLRLLVREE